LDGNAAEQDADEREQARHQNPPRTANAAFICVIEDLLDHENSNSLHSSGILLTCHFEMM
jgi:hypothetical protein